MGSLSIWHLLIILALAVLLFGGGGKLSRIMGDLGKGITSFKASLKEGEKQPDDTHGGDDRRQLADGRTIEGGVRQAEAIQG